MPWKISLNIHSFFLFTKTMLEGEINDFSGLINAALREVLKFFFGIFMNIKFVEK